MFDDIACQELLLRRSKWSSRRTNITEWSVVMALKTKDNDSKMKRKLYEKELRKLQVELCHLQEWVKAKGLKVIIVFEGRDAAGKGGTIKALTERVSPRVFRVAALPAPSDREKTQIFIQRYIARFPAAGEIVIFDRSWYNRAASSASWDLSARSNLIAFLSCARRSSNTSSTPASRLSSSGWKLARRNKRRVCRPC